MNKEEIKKIVRNEIERDKAFRLITEYTYNYNVVGLYRDPVGNKMKLPKEIQEYWRNRIKESWDYIKEIDSK